MRSWWDKRRVYEQGNVDICLSPHLTNIKYIVSPEKLNIRRHFRKQWQHKCQMLFKLRFWPVVKVTPLILFLAVEWPGCWSCGLGQPQPGHTLCSSSFLGWGGCTSLFCKGLVHFSLYAWPAEGASSISARPQVEIFSFYHVVWTFTEVQ